MDHSGSSRDIDNAMQQLPALAETTNPPFGRSERQRNQQNKSGTTRRDEWPLIDVLNYRVDVEKLIKPNIGREVQTTVKEREQADDSAVLDQPLYACEAAQRGDRQRYEQQNERPETSLVRNFLDRVGAQISLECIEAEQRERDQCGKKD